MKILNICLFSFNIILSIYNAILSYKNDESCGGWISSALGWFVALICEIQLLIVEKN